MTALSTPYRRLQDYFIVVLSAMLVALSTGCRTPKSESPITSGSAAAESNIVQMATAIRNTSMAAEGHRTASITNDLPAANGTARSLLLAGDVVSIKFGYSTNYDTLQKISIDGMLNLPEVGEVQAAKKTSPELQTELKRLYEPHVKGDTITVNVVTSSATVYVLGAVLQPGRMVLEHPMTALEVLASVGGFDSRRAKLSQVRVYRVVDGKQVQFQLDLNRVLGGVELDLFMVKPFDIIYVPEKKFNF